MAGINFLLFFCTWSNATVAKGRCSSRLPVICAICSPGLMESQNNSRWKEPHEICSPSANSKQGQLEVRQDCSGHCPAGPWKPPRKETAQPLGSLLHCSDGLVVPPVSNSPPCTASLVADRCHFPCRRRCPTTVTCCILLVMLPQTEVSSPSLLPGKWTYFAIADLQVEKEPSACCQKLQAFSLPCCGIENYCFFVLVASVYF